MKSNNIKYQIRQLVYLDKILIDDYVYDLIFNDLEEVDLFIYLAKIVDKTKLSEFKVIYITEVL